MSIRGPVIKTARLERLAYACMIPTLFPHLDLSFAAQHLLESSESKAWPLVEVMKEHNKRQQSKDAISIKLLRLHKMPLDFPGGWCFVGFAMTFERSK